MSLQERQAELVETHRAVHEADQPYVLVGGVGRVRLSGTIHDRLAWSIA